MKTCSELMKASLRAAAVLAIAAMAARQSQAEDLVIPLELPQPNFIGLGVGAYPDYFGSSDYNVGSPHSGGYPWVARASCA